MNTSQYNQLFFPPTVDFFSFLRKLLRWYSAALRCLKEVLFLLVINGRGSVKGYAPPQYRVSHLYGEDGVNLYWLLG